MLISDHSVDKLDKLPILLEKAEVSIPEIYMNEPAHDFLVLIAYASSKGSDQTAQITDIDECSGQFLGMKPH